MRKSASNRVVFLLASLLVGGLATFAFFSYVKKISDEIVVYIHDKHEALFINEHQIKQAIRKYALKNPDDFTADKVNLSAIEKSLNKFAFIRQAQVSLNLKGNLVVDIFQHRPIARIIASKGKGRYISDEGNILSLSNDYTSRVVILRGNGADSLLSPTFNASAQGKLFRELLFFIEENAFWKAQVAEVVIDQQMNLTLYPQVGKQKIRFGKVDSFRRKFWKLNIFYEKIIPARGWGRFKEVKLQYDGQIICR